jgi:hypothetical protein
MSAATATPAAAAASSSSGEQSARMLRAVMRIQALFRGRQSREAVAKPQMARLKAAAGLGLPTMARLSRLAKARTADFIAELESEAKRGEFAAATLIHEAEDAEAHGNSRVQNEIREQRKILDKEEDAQRRQQEEEERKKRQQLQLQSKGKQKGKPLSEAEKQQLDEFAFTPEEQARFEQEAGEDTGDSSSSYADAKPSLFRGRDFPVYPKLMLSAEAPEEEKETKTGQLVVVQTCWVEVPAKPMRYLRVQQEDLDAATMAVPGAENAGKSGNGARGGGGEGDDDVMSEFSDDPSSQSELGSEDSLGNLFVDSDEDDGFLDHDLELSTNLE